MNGQWIDGGFPETVNDANATALWSALGLV